MQVRLTIRMKMNAMLVADGARVADIGCDHGYVSMWLVREKHCPVVIATDVNQGPLSRAEKNIRAAGLEDRIQTRAGNGLSVIGQDEVDTILIAGMGGMKICEILSESLSVTEGKTLVLQPQSDIEAVRRHLHKLSFKIDRESICMEDGKYYIAIRAVPGIDTPYTDTEYRFSRLLAEEGGRIYRSYMRQMTDKLMEVLKQLDRSDPGPEAILRKKELEDELLELRSHF